MLLALTWRRASFALAIAAAFVLSPIVWFDFYALAAIPLAIARPRLSLVWFLPLATWGLPSSGIAADPVWGVGRVLLVYAIVLLVAAQSERMQSRARSGRTIGVGQDPGRAVTAAARDRRMGLDAAIGTAVSVAVLRRGSRVLLLASA